MNQKTRGYDDRPERQRKFRFEARYARSRFNDYFTRDRYYNRNLSAQQPYELAYPPRVNSFARLLRVAASPPKVLFLSAAHKMGSGVAIVMKLHANHLVSEGFDVYVGGPEDEEDLEYPGCIRTYFATPEDAAVFAYQNDIAIIIPETPPFYSVVKWIGDWARTIFVDHGEPPPQLFPDAAERESIDAEKRFCFLAADVVLPISTAVALEGTLPDLDILPNGNSHLFCWRDDLMDKRRMIRKKLGLDDQFFVLNVCRFGAGERFYKGIDGYGAALEQLQVMRPSCKSDFVFGLAGRGSDEDVDVVTKMGLSAFANISDELMQELYIAADYYVSLSSWEGYNLGIGQALAAGLGVAASDIPAHRAFPILLRLVHWNFVSICSRSTTFGARGIFCRGRLI